MNYALVNKTTNIVENVIVGYLELEDYICVPTENAPVEEGDLYQDGYFYRNGERLYSLLQEYQIAYNILMAGGQTDEQ